MDEKSIQKLLKSNYLPSNYGKRNRNHKFMVSNVYLYEWESDLLTITQSDNIWEFEIKCSKWDYLNDFKKKAKHKAFETISNLESIPNRFWYVSPRDLINREDVPEYAGLIYVEVNSSQKYLNIIKHAPILHNEKVNSDIWEKLAIKLCNKLV